MHSLLPPNEPKPSRSRISPSSSTPTPAWPYCNSHCTTRTPIYTTAVALPGETFFYSLSSYPHSFNFNPLLSLVSSQSFKIPKASIVRRKALIYFQEHNRLHPTRPRPHKMPEQPLRVRLPLRHRQHRELHPGRAAGERDGEGEWCGYFLRTGSGVDLCAES